MHKKPHIIHYDDVWLIKAFFLIVAIEYDLSRGIARDCNHFRHHPARR